MLHKKVNCINNHLEGIMYQCQYHTTQNKFISRINYKAMNYLNMRTENFWDDGIMDQNQGGIYTEA